MKTCVTCRAIHPDDYNGQCPHCGAPMGTVRAAGAGLSGDIGRAARESAAQERAIRRHDYGAVKLPGSLLETARSFIVEKKPPDA